MKIKNTLKHIKDTFKTELRFAKKYFKRNNICLRKFKTIYKNIHI
jgi:hypothetical protein